MRSVAGAVAQRGAAQALANSWFPKGVETDAVQVTGPRAGAQRSATIGASGLPGPTSARTKRPCIRKTLHLGVTQRMELRFTKTHRGF